MIVVAVWMRLSFFRFSLANRTYAQPIHNQRTKKHPNKISSAILGMAQFFVSENIVWSGPYPRGHLHSSALGRHSPPKKHKSQPEEVSKKDELIEQTNFIPFNKSNRNNKGLYAYSSLFGGNVIYEIQKLLRLFLFCSIDCSFQKNGQSIHTYYQPHDMNPLMHQREHQSLF